MINEKTRECTLDERPLVLTPTEFLILSILCRKKGQVVSAEAIFMKYGAMNITAKATIRSPCTSDICGKK